MRIGINCGHTVEGTTGSGAVGILVESRETREIGKRVIELLRQAGHKVVDCTDDRASSVAANLKEICRLANAQPLDAFISFHFNAGGGRGCEAYTYGSGDVAFAGKIKTALYFLGFRDRGIKDGSNLYIIKNTRATASLIEICFVDNEDDANLYVNLGAERISKAIAEAINGGPIQKEELTMTQYEELKREIETLKNPVIYNYIDDNMPSWARPTIQKLVDNGILKGDEGGLNLTEDMLRIFVINDRAGLYD